MPFSTSGRQRYAAYTNFQNCYQLSRSLRWRYNDLILFLLIALTQSASEQQHTELLDEKREAELLSDLFNETTLADSLNGFLLVVDSRSSIIYISPNVSRCLGLTQVCCIFRYIYLWCVAFFVIFIYYTYFTDDILHFDSSLLKFFCIAAKM